MSVALFACVRKFILNTAHPLKAGLYALPVFYGVTLFVNVFSIVHDGPERKTANFFLSLNSLVHPILYLVLYMNNIPTWVALIGSLALGIVTALLVQIFIVPWQRRKILGHSQARKPVKFSIEGSSGKCNESFQ